MEYLENNHITNCLTPILELPSKNSIPNFDNGSFLNKTFLEAYENHIKQVEKGNTNSLFLSKTANTWMQEAMKQPIPKKLFDVFWIEGEVCILFASSNVGKSILAVQIADSISRGIPIQGFDFDAGKQSVLYCDFELTSKQFQIRYSDENNNPYTWDSDFKRVEINPSAEIPFGKTYEDYFNDCLESEIKRNNFRVLIIDNLTYLRSDTEKAKDASELMKHLKRLKNKYGLSVLVLAHTPKRDETKQIAMNDLAGSSMLMNFCDTSFTIGRSCIDKDLRYIKQLKARSTEIKFDSENVATCQISKSDNFLKFDFIDVSFEWKHLKQETENDKNKKLHEAIKMNQQGVTNIEIAKHFGVSEGAIRKWIKKGEKQAHE